MIYQSPLFLPCGKIRGAYRIVEFAQGDLGFLVTHEGVLATSAPTPARMSLLICYQSIFLHARHAPPLPCDGHLRPAMARRLHRSSRYGERRSYELSNRQALVLGPILLQQ